MTPVTLGVVGAGFISDEYLKNLTAFPDVNVRFVADQDRRRAGQQAGRFGIHGAGSLEELLRDPTIELLVNLTPPQAHTEINARALAAGKHVWSEKPLSTRLEDADRLRATAQTQGLLLAAAPDTMLAPGLQQAFRAIRDGRIGTPRSGLALMQTSGPEAWHPNPEFVYAPGAGPLFELGPYFVTAVVLALGPIARVTAASSRIAERRAVRTGPRAGTGFPVQIDTEVAALIQTVAGAHVVLQLSFDAPADRLILEITGTSGTVQIPAPSGFLGTSTIAVPYGTPTSTADTGSSYGRGVGALEAARALRAGRPPRTNADLAFHVLEVLTAIDRSATAGAPVDIRSRPPVVDLLPDGWDPFRPTLTGSEDPSRHHQGEVLP